MDNQQPSVEAEWKTVCEYDRYEVSRKGEIRHKARKHVLKPRLNPTGYAYVNFSINGHRENFAIHRIVANAFIPNPNGYSEINHKDYNRANNCVDNLEWVDSSQNKKHAFLKKENRDCRGKKVEQYTKNGEYIQTFVSLSAAARKMKCTVGAISNCCLGRSKTSQGYHWKFSEGSTTKYERKPSSSVRGSSKEDEDIV